MCKTRKRNLRPRAHQSSLQGQGQSMHTKKLLQAQWLVNCTECKVCSLSFASVSRCVRRGRFHIPVYFCVMVYMHHLVLALNSSVNFIIYCCVGRDFRNRLREMLCGRRRGRGGGGGGRAGGGGGSPPSPRRERARVCTPSTLTAAAVSRSNGFSGSARFLSPNPKSQRHANGLSTLSSSLSTNEWAAAAVTSSSSRG